MSEHARRMCGSRLLLRQKKRWPRRATPVSQMVDAFRYALLGVPDWRVMPVFVALLSAIAPGLRS